MGRPRTLGPPVQFRLPIDLHQIAAERAEANGLTVNEYLAGRLIQALERQRDRTTTTSTASNIQQMDDPYRRPVNPQWKASMK